MKLTYVKQELITTNGSEPGNSVEEKTLIPPSTTPEKADEFKELFVARLTLADIAADF